MSSPVQATDPSQAAPPDGRGVPLIANPDLPVSDVRTARLLFAAMIETADVPELLGDLVPVLMADSESSSSHLHFIQGVTKVLTALVERSPRDQRFVEWQRKANANLKTTLDSARAYDTAGQPNPHAVWFPMPDRPQNPRSVYDELPWSQHIPLVDRTTKIGSAGSCFASEISFRFQREGYNYLIKEKNPDSANGLDKASANWGIIFNVPSLRQLIERSFGVRSEPSIVWEQQTARGSVYRDPWREQVEYASLAEYEQSWSQHLRASREVFEEVEVFVMTLGLNEVWELRTDGTAFARCPWQLSPALVRYRTPSLEENLEHLEAMWSLWKKHNPGVKLILTVSPVPLLATFRAPEQHVITANCSSKATLRIVAEAFAQRHPDVHYFPSFETVMYCTKDRWRPDNRHVSDEAVGKVMSLFDRMFLKPAVQPQPTPVLESPPPAALPAVVSQGWYAGIQDEERRVARLLQSALVKEAQALPAPILEAIAVYEQGLTQFAASGTQDPRLYAAQRRLYTMTQGSFCDVVLSARQHAHPPLESPVDPGVGGLLGKLDACARGNVIDRLHTDGVVVLPGMLSEERCQEIETFAREHPVRPITGAGEYGAEHLYGQGGPQVTRHTIRDECVLAQPSLARLAFDPTVVSVARSYLGCEPVITQALLFWSKALFKEPDSLASQLYHFDMNRLNFMKALIYVTDVGEERGPHCYVRGSHRNKPDALWRDGRISDAEIQRHYPSEDILEITGGRGTLILADTRGFHRGKRLEQGERLIFHVEIADSLVGKSMDPCELVTTPWHREAARAEPRLWHRYRLGPAA